jgi:hypothetical protein
MTYGLYLQYRQLSARIQRGWVEGEVSLFSRSLITLPDILKKRAQRFVEFQVETRFIASPDDGTSI